MRPTPRRGEIIRAQDIDRIARRAYEGATVSDSLVTSAGTIALRRQNVPVGLFLINDERWQARQIGNQFWLAAHAQRTAYSETAGWAVPVANETVLLWWSWFGPVAENFKVPVVNRYVAAFLDPSRQKWEVLTTFQPIFRIVLKGSFDVYGVAPAYFVDKGGNQYTDVSINVYDPLHLYIGMGDKFGYATYFFDGLFGRFEILQLQC
ncbi:hypothetical protein [Thermogutta sp.]|uniref:hypothetical protein n=1 Tax=Thermogutta sp. TaxID=1962930 RepID=UPI0032207D64